MSLIYNRIKCVYHRVKKKKTADDIHNEIDTVLLTFLS